MSRTALAVVGVVVAVSMIAPAFSGIEHHTVSAGESPSSIVKRYYGNYELTDLLLRFNEDASSVIHPGQKLGIPYCEVHRVRPGDTWSVLAERFTGRRSTYRAIAWLNGLEPGDLLSIGQRIVMPVGMPYRLDRGDTLQGLAERFYGDATEARVLMSFNDIDDPRRLSVGQQIEVPLVSLLLQKQTPAKVRQEPKPAKKEPAPPPASTAEVAEVRPEVPPAEPRASEPPRFQREIVAARDAFDRGEFARAWKVVESLHDRVMNDGSDAERGELLQLEAFLHVAYDRSEEACVAYDGLIELAPETKLDRDLVSPKIRKILVGCGKRS